MYIHLRQSFARGARSSGWSGSTSWAKPLSGSFFIERKCLPFILRYDKEIPVPEDVYNCLENFMMVKDKDPPEWKNPEDDLFDSMTPAKLNRVNFVIIQTYF